MALSASTGDSAGAFWGRQLKSHLRTLPTNGKSLISDAAQGWLVRGRQLSADLKFRQGAGAGLDRGPFQLAPT